MVNKLIRYCLENKVIVGAATILIIAWGIRVAPFDWDLGRFPRDPVPVDAIPDIGENQQIVFTKWMGRSPRDVKYQISKHLIMIFLVVLGEKNVSSFSLLVLHPIQVIFMKFVIFYRVGGLI